MPTGANRYIAAVALAGVLAGLVSYLLNRLGY